MMNLNHKIYVGHETSCFGGYQPRELYLTDLKDICDVNTPWYGSLHQYSKNKIHCSCPMCAFNPKRHGRRFLKYQYTAQDMRNMEKQDFSEKEYLQMAV